MDRDAANNAASILTLGGVWVLRRGYWTGGGRVGVPFTARRENDSQADGPGISRVGMIYNPDNPVSAVYLNSFKAVAHSLPFSRLIFLFMWVLTSNARSKVWQKNRMEALSLRPTLR
jgi:hypothetical protein